MEAVLDMGTVFVYLCNDSPVSQYAEAYIYAYSCSEKEECFSVPAIEEVGHSPSC